jgi:dTDP-4-dehydrorhamnose 3,5-epimerase
MNDEIIHNFDLEKHETKDIDDGHVNGSLTVIWRDWDNILKKHPKMVYVTSVNLGEIKGPHLHTKRDSYFTCIRGSVVFVIKDNSGKYIEIESNEEKPTLIHVPKNFASAHINVTNQTSTILTLTNIAWKPNDNEMKNIIFDDYDWNKWKNN